jgi:hypothetical protein
MARKKPAKEPDRSAAEYYRLNTKAVDDLVTADVSNSPKVSRKELDKYRSGPKIHLSDWVKVILVKWWFAGAVCFFFLWGLGTVVPNRENQLIITGLGLGFVTDLLVNKIFRYYEKTPGGNNRWMMVTKKGFISLPLNVIYAFVLLACIVGTYNAVNAVWLAASGQQDAIPVGVGPILFGLFATVWDLIFLGMKQTLKRIISDADRQVKHHV